MNFERSAHVKEPKLPKNVEFIISRFREHGYRADIVGGCVRDFLLGKEPNDYDLTTSATPEEMREVFSDMRTVDTGIKHGTLTVLIDGEPYEITTYRVDGDYKDHRHPDKVTFSRTLSDDLSRRDFTVNAIAYNPYDGFVDLFFGMEDVRHGIIRAVGDPTRRFDEDALRILRAIRFASVLGFEIEEETARAAREGRALLKNVSGERIFAEWKKLLSGVDAHKIISAYSDILGEFLMNTAPIYIADKERFFASDTAVRWASLYMNEKNTKESFLRCAERLHTDNATKKLISGILAYSDFQTDNRIDVNRLMMEVGVDTALGVIGLRILIGKADISAIETLYALINEGAPYRISDLKVSGHDLVSLGIKGEKIGEALSKILLSVIHGRVRNDKEDILDYLNKI